MKAILNTLNHIFVELQSTKKWKNLTKLLLTIIKSKSLTLISQTLTHTSKKLNNNQKNLEKKTTTSYLVLIKKQLIDKLKRLSENLLLNGTQIRTKDPKKKWPLLKVNLKKLTKLTVC